MNIKALVGAGDRIVKPVLPFLVIGVALNVLYPSVFGVGGPLPALKVAALVALVPGVVGWLWSVVLILTRVPKHELITGGPFALVKHPLYTAVSLLVVPAIGILLNSWLGVVIGLVMYLASRRYAPGEEETLSREFGDEWDRYATGVLAPWL